MNQHIERMHPDLFAYLVEHDQEYQCFQSKILQKRSANETLEDDTDDGNQIMP